MKKISTSIHVHLYDVPDPRLIHVIYNELVVAHVRSGPSWSWLSVWHYHIFEVHIAGLGWGFCSVAFC